MLFAVPFGDHLIAQQAIISSKGRGIRVVVAADKIVHSFVRSNDSEFKSNLHQGGHIEAFESPTALADMSIKLARTFGLKMGSIDYLFGEEPDEFWLCEINSTPGMAYLFEAEQTNNTQLIEKFMAIPGKMLAKEGIR